MPLGKTAGMGEVLVITGPPGAGKSTIAEQVVDTFDPGVLMEGDAFFRFLRKGATDPWKPEADTQNTVVTAAAAAAVGAFAIGPATIVYEGVLGPWFLPTFFGLSGLASISYAVLLPPIDEVIGRIGDRAGHDFADADAARRMHDQFSAAGIEARHLFANPADEQAETVEAIVAAHRDGTIDITA